MHAWIGRCCLLAAIALQIFTLSAQQPAPEVSIVSNVFSPTPLFQVSPGLVEVDVVVHDRDGNAVGTLGQSDFTLLDEGKPQPIASFTILRGSAPDAATSAPAAAASAAAPPLVAPSRNLALFFDDLHTEAAQLSQARLAALAFLRHGLAPGDRVAIYTASGEGGAPFTSDATAAVRAVAALRSHTRASAVGTETCPRITPDMAYAIANNLDPRAAQVATAQGVKCNCAGQEPPPPPPPSGRGGRRPPPPTPDACQQTQAESVRERADAIWQQTEQQTADTFAALAGVMNDLAKQPGARTLLLVSSGFLNGGQELAADQDALIQGAVRDNILVNALDARGLWADLATPGDDADNPPIDDPSASIAQSQLTSAEALDMMNGMADISRATGGTLFQASNDLHHGIQQLVGAPESSYVLAFSTSNVKPDGAFHRIEVKLKSPQHLSVQARKGYFAPRPGAASGPAGLEQKLQAAALSGDELSQMEAQLDTHAAAAGVQVVIHVAPGALHFSRHADRSDEQLAFAGFLTNAQGRGLAGKQAVMTLQLTPASLDRVMRQGINASMTFNAPAGGYRLRAVILESGQGLISTFSRTVTLP